MKAERKNRKIIIRLQRTPVTYKLLPSLRSFCTLCSCITLVRLVFCNLLVRSPIIKLKHCRHVQSLISSDVSSLGLSFSEVNPHKVAISATSSTKCVTCNFLIKSPIIRLKHRGHVQSLISNDVSSLLGISFNEVNPHIVAISATSSTKCVTILITANQCITKAFYSSVNVCFTYARHVYLSILFVAFLCSKLPTKTIDIIHLILRF
jgi:hypothetical protein